jgi:beta-lactamase class A
VDDVDFLDPAGLRDVLQRTGHRAALLPAQITVAASLIAAASEVMRTGDLLLCSAARAAELGLLFDLVRPQGVDRVLRAAGINGIAVRHRMEELTGTHANTGSPRAFADLFEALWAPARFPSGVAAQARALLGENLLRHRLAPDFSSDASRWSSKTGTLLNLRHEAGVVAHDEGGTFAVAALTESRVPAAIQPVAEAVMSQVARELHDQLRNR